MSFEQRSHIRQRSDGARYTRGSGGGERYGRDDRRNFYRRGYQRSSSPARDDEMEDIELRLRGLIIKIGDKISPELRVNLNKMKNILDSDYSKYPETVQDTLKACISELPAKAPVYGALLGLLNVSNHEVVGKLMTEFNELLKETVSNQDWFKLKQLLRFYGELVNSNVILPAAYCELVNSILQVLNEPNSGRDRQDCIVYMVLSVLPWSAKELHDGNADGFQQILKRIELYMARRGSIPEVDVLKQYRYGNYEFVNQDMIAHLWELIQDLSAKGWEVPFLPRPYKWFDKEFSSALQHEVPEIVMPRNREGTNYIAPERPFKIFVDDNGTPSDTVPDHKSLEYFVLQDLITDIIRIFEPNRKECAKYLLGIPQNFEPGIFRSRSQSQSQSQQEASATSEGRMEVDVKGWAITDVLLEVIFSQILKLPCPPFRQVLYTCILTELCRADVSFFPLALGRCIKVLFEHLEFMDIECVSRLSTWFAHHLSNFGFQWDWEAWSQTLSLEEGHPKKFFVRETLLKLMRLSYYERVKSVIPKAFHDLLPPVAPGPEFEYSDSNHLLYQDAKEVTDRLKAKKSTDDIQVVLDKFKDERAKQGLDENTQETMVRELFLQCLLLVGSKSFSHILNVVERYLEVLRSLNTTPEARLHTVKVVAKFWRRNTQLLGILLDKLLNYRVIDPASVISWVFEQDQLDNPARSYAWEILQNTLNKVVARVSQVRSKLENCQKIHAENQAKRAQEAENEMAQAEAQQELDTLRIIEKSLATVMREQKEVFVIAYQKFMQVLQTSLSAYPKETPEREMSWNTRWILGWFREILRRYYKECRGFTTTLETVVFTDDLDERIHNMFRDVKNLNSYTVAV